MSNVTSVSNIRTIISPLFGQKAWGVTLGEGSFLTLEFGNPVEDKRGSHSHGEWHLWITYCAWRLEQGDRVLVASEDDRDRIQQSIQSLENTPLLSVEVMPPAWDTALRFDHQLTLKLFSMYSTDCENWLLFTPNQYVLSIGPGIDWSYESSEKIPA